MKRFWDHRAAENALYFVDNRLVYRNPEEGQFWAGGEQDLDALLRSVGANLTPDDDVVEIGCGVGRLTRVLAGRARSVRALDVSPRMLQLAGSYNPDLDNVTWLEGDGTTLAEIADSSAEVCISYITFQHIPDPRITLGYIAEIGRVLRPGGWAAFQISNDPGVHAPRGLRERARTRTLGLARRGPRGQDHPAWLGSAVRLDDLREVAAANGMEVTRVIGQGTQYCQVRLGKPAPRHPAT